MLTNDTLLVTDNSNSTTKLDFECYDTATEATWILEVKEKRQPFGKRWQKYIANAQRVDEFWPGMPEEELFCLDELSLRKAVNPERTFFLVRDVPGNRLFLNSASELACFERIRLERVGPTGVAKGKLNYDLRDFRQIEDLTQIVPTIDRMLYEAHHLVSECVGPQVGRV